jgi:hypothetical protein
VDDYTQTTLLRHRKVILEKLGYHAFSWVYQQQLTTEADFLLSKQVRLKDIFESLLLFLEKKRVEIPSYNILAHIITDAFRRYQKDIVARIEMCLSQEGRTVFDTLLAIDEAYQTPEKQDLKLKRYKITLLKGTQQAIRPSRIQENIVHLLALKEYFQRAQPVIRALQLGIETIRHYATIANKAQIPQISRRSTEKYLYLLAFVAHQYYSLQDALSDIFLRSVQSAINKADDALTLVLREQHGSRSAAVEHLLSKYLTKNELIAKLALILSAQELSDAEKVVKANHLLISNVFQLGGSGARGTGRRPRRRPAVGWVLLRWRPRRRFP